MTSVWSWVLSVCLMGFHSLDVVLSFSGDKEFGRNRALT